MRLDKIEVLLRHLNSKATGNYRHGWVEARCPRSWKHGGQDVHPSFGIREEATKASRAKCWSCGFSGDLVDLLYDVGLKVKELKLTGYNIAKAADLINHEYEDLDIDPSLIPDYEEVPAPVEKVFPESWLLGFQSAMKFQEAMDYWTDVRHLPLYLIPELDIRFDPNKRRIGFPFRNFKGHLMGVQGRAIDPENDLRYFMYGLYGHRNPHVWMGEQTLDLDKPVVLLEGPVDYASVFRVYPNVAASFTTGFHPLKLRRVADAVEIITLYDHGAGGDSAREVISKTIKTTPIHHIVPTEQEDDAGAMSADQIASYLSNYVECIQPQSI